MILLPLAPLRPLARSPHPASLARAGPPVPFRFHELEAVVGSTNGPLCGRNKAGATVLCCETHVPFGLVKEGQDIAEYAVMLAVILIIIMGTIRLIGGNANKVFSSVASSIQ